MDESVQFRALSAWSKVLFAALAGVAACIVSLALGSDSATAAEGGAETASIAVSVPSENFGIPDHLLSDPDAVTPEALGEDADEHSATVIVDTVAAPLTGALEHIAAAQDPITELVDSVSTAVSLPDVPPDPLPDVLPDVLPHAVPTPGLSPAGNTPASRVAPVAATWSPGLVGEAAEPGRSVLSVQSADAPATRVSVGDHNTPAPLHPAMPAPTGPSPTPRSSSGPGGGLEQPVADLSPGGHNIADSRSASVSDGTARRCPAPSFDPGSTPD